MIKMNGKNVRMVLDVTSAIGYEVGTSFNLRIKRSSGEEVDVIVTTDNGKQA